MNPFGLIWQYRAEYPSYNVQWPFHILWKQTRHSQACVNYMEFTNFSFYLHPSKHTHTHIQTHSIITHKLKHNHFYPYHLRHITKQKRIKIITDHRIHSNTTHGPQRMTAACTLPCPVLQSTSTVSHNKQSRTDKMRIHPSLTLCILPRRPFYSPT